MKTERKMICGAAVPISRPIAVLLIGLVVALGPPLATGQTASWTVQGVVEDSTGGAIAGAQITLRQANGTVRGTAATNAYGYFGIAGVPPGKYVLHTESKGFEISRIDVSVSSADPPHALRIVLKVGSVSQTVTVNAEGEYVQSTTATATKTDIPVYQTPLTVDSVTRALIQDQGSRNLEQILQNVSAVRSDDSSAGWGAKTFQVRGFDLGSTLLQDGVRLPIYAEADPATIDHVDVLKGSAAGLYGRIEPGGVVNIVTLKPQPNRDYDVGLTLGPYGDVRTELDATGPLNGKSLLYRGILAYESANSFRDTVQTRYFTLVPSLQWLPSANDRVDFRFEFKKWRDTTDFGLPVVPVSIDPNTGDTLTNRLPNLPRSVYVGPSGNFYDVKTVQETVAWTHDFGKNWQLNPTFVHYHVDQPGHEGGPTGWIGTPSDGWGAQDPTLATYYVGNPSNLGAHGSFAEIDLTGKFSTARLRHNFLFSTEYQSTSNFYETWIYSGNVPTIIDVTSPVYQPVSTFYTSPGSTDPTYGYTGGNHWWSATLQDQVVLTRRLRLLAGLRFDHAIASSSAPPAAPTLFPYSSVGDSKVSPRVGRAMTCCHGLRAMLAMQKPSAGTRLHFFTTVATPARRPRGNGKVGLKGTG